MNEFFHNLSMQALSESICRKLDTISKLNKSINRLLVNEMLAYENAQIENFFNPPTIPGGEQALNNKIERAIVKEILKDEKPPFDINNEDDSDIPIAKTAEEIEQEKIIQNSLFLETELKKVKRDFETLNNLV